MIKELRAGDTQISAAGWNEMRAAVQGMTPAQQQYNSSQRNPVYITIKNITGTDLPAFAVVKISGATYSRTGSNFVDLATANGVELNGDTPAAATDTIAITQAACASGEFVKAIVSGATPVMFAGDVTAGRYLQVAPGVTDYLHTTDTPTNIRVLSDAGYATGTTTTPVGCYALIDYTDDRERFKITCTAANGLASVAKKGAVFMIARGAKKRCLAVCQEDVPDGYTGDYWMPYYTPEQNYGVIPNELVGGIYSSGNIVGRRGVGSGDYAFSAKRLDYAYQRGQYTYEPRFVYSGAAVDRGSTVSPRVGISIEGHVYPVTFPIAITTYGLQMMAPDVYTGDTITVLVEEAYTGDYGASVTAIEYPLDCAKGTTLVVPSDAPITNRGWIDTTTQGVTLPANLSCYTKDIGNALI